MSSLHSSIWSFSLFWEIAKHLRLEPCRSVESAWLIGESFKIKIFKWFLWSPVLPILIALASVARVENHVSSSKVQACLVPPDGKGIKALDLQPIKVMQTCLISPCLLSIQYWLPPWLWHGHRPTGLCKSSLFPGLWGKIASDIGTSIKVTDRFLLPLGFAWITCQCIGCSTHFSLLH